MSGYSGRNQRKRGQFQNRRVLWFPPGSKPPEDPGAFEFDFGGSEVPEVDPSYASENPKIAQIIQAIEARKQKDVSPSPISKFQVLFKKAIKQHPVVQSLMKKESELIKQNVKLVKENEALSIFCLMQNFV